MYSSSRRYRKNDWWDLVTVIGQELEKDDGPQTYYYILDELKWRMVESISEGSTFKIKKKAIELYEQIQVSQKKWTKIEPDLAKEIELLLEFLLDPPTKILI
ncbi:hypothetical protein M902_0838 [Bacteriovorax sp. BAL6_X]|uniref:hypothetical protein n=1 Tax=Bacteriovorax sp. BAL6_X TaxID=1201290 RepID=UPI0003856D25|nr:hypothetical protein [Bacteriovorax sp. BAL6_X]EPZ49492.1 hypothetical protein M902_0838 [Bacteriovorax sp. BAL6_X]